MEDPENQVEEKCIYELGVLNATNEISIYTYKTCQSLLYRIVFHAYLC